MIGKKHILVVSQYFYPEQFRINDICIEWVKRGYKVTVVTGIPNYPQGEFYAGYDKKHKRTETWNGIDIIRIPISARKTGAVNLAKNYFSFVWSGFLWKVKTKIKADCVYIYEVSPMTQALVGVWYARKMKIPCYLYVTDLWPDNVEIVTGIHNKLVIGSINKMVNYIYKRCDEIFTSSKSFIDKMVERKVPSNKLHFWPQYAEEFYMPYEIEDSSVIEKESSIVNDGIPNIVFAGNIGFAQGLGTTVQAAKILKSKNVKARFQIIGDGRYKSQMIEEVKELDVKEYFNFIPRVPATDVPKYMAAGDAALICLDKSEVFAMTIPAKTQSCLACGTPIIVSADGEIRQIIENARCGFTSAAKDAEALANNIIKFSRCGKEDRVAMSKAAIEYYKKNFDKKMLMDKMDMYLEGDQL